MGNLNVKDEKTKELTEEQMQNLLNNTAFDREQILDWHKGYIEECPTGKMNKDSFKRFLFEFVKTYDNLFLNIL